MREKCELKSIVLKAPAKLNLFLNITGKREDGYHLIESIMQTIDLCDEVSIQLANGNEICVTSNEQGIPLDEGNIVSKIARKVAEYKKIEFGCKIHIEKNIPTGAGMGGGSSDGAITLIGLNKLLSLNLSHKELLKIAESVGADIPFLLSGGTAKVLGIGEKVESISPLYNCYFVIVKPDVSIDTKKAYKMLDEVEIKETKNVEDIILAIKNNSVEDVGKNLYNCFELIAPKEINEIKTMLNRCGAINSLMTGSGSAVFGVFPDFDSAELARKALNKIYDKVFIARPVEGY